jgi:hypothetical protein
MAGEVLDGSRRSEKMVRDEPEVGRYGIESMYEENYRKIEGSEIFLSLFNEKMGEEALPAMQLGIALLLGKPVYLLVKKGAVVPEKLGKVADRIEYYGSEEEMKESLRRMLG